jgi:hypothetical protein
MRAGQPPSIVLAGRNEGTAVSKPEEIWFTTFAVVGAVSGMVAALVLWLMLTRPFTVVQALVGLP